MTNTLVWRVDEELFERTAVEAIFRSAAGFREVRFDEPGGALIEAEFVRPEAGDWVFVRLSKNADVISITDATETSFQVAFLLQQRMDVPLRVIDTDYTFDLKLSDYATAGELNAANDAARLESSE